jgi:hypothetical protein
VQTEDVISCDPFMTFYRFSPAVVLYGEILSNGTCAISYEGMRGIDIIGFKYTAEKIVECFLVTRSAR